MLYATTRTERDVYTVQRALTEDRAPDQGLYVPFRETRFSQMQLSELEQKSQQENLAVITNLLFKSRLTAWDLEFTVGRKPLRVQKLGRRTLAGERWHNTAGDFSCTVAHISEKLKSSSEISAGPGTWAQVAEGIASLFALYAISSQSDFRQGKEQMDLAVPEGNLLSVVSGWFARSWGLPIGRIVCGCREDSPLWELIHSGQLRTDRLVDKNCAAGLELLIYCCGGRREVERFTDACFAEMSYVPSDNTMRHLRQGLYVSVISSRRIRATIPNVWSAHKYILHPEAVLGYAGLLDYRTATGESGWGIVLCDQDPQKALGTIADAFGCSEQAVRDRL